MDLKAQKCKNIPKFNQNKKKRMKEEVIRDRVVKKKSRDKVTKEKQQY